MNELLNPGWTRRWLRLEAAAAFVVLVSIYNMYSLPWPWFFVGFFVPDLTILAYRGGPRVGAWIYNLAHTYAFALPLGAFGWWIGRNELMAIGLILAAHVAFDRMLGFGLKEKAGFGFTHLGPLRRWRK